MIFRFIRNNETKCRLISEKNFKCILFFLKMRKTGLTFQCLSFIFVKKAINEIKKKMFLFRFQPLMAIKIKC